MPFQFVQKNLETVPLSEIKLLHSFTYGIQADTYVKLDNDTLVPGRAVCMREDGSLCMFYIDTLVEAGPKVISVVFPE